MTYQAGAYHVQAYEILPGDKYPKYHTVRAFVFQGDAMLFKDMINGGRIDPYPYIRSYQPGTVVHRITYNDGRPIMRTRALI